MGVYWASSASAWHALVQGTADQPYEIVLRVWDDTASDAGEWSSLELGAVIGDVRVNLLAPIETTTD